MKIMIDLLTFANEIFREGDQGFDSVPQLKVAQMVKEGAQLSRSLEIYINKHLGA